MIEDEVKNFFSTENQAIKTYLQQNLNYHDDFQIISEHKIHHGLKVDKIILDDRGRYLSLIECKGDVGTTEFVRGIGQIYQYKAQALHELKDRMAPVHSIVLSFPNNINTRDTPVQVEHLKYPAQSHLFIINQSNKSYKSIFSITLFFLITSRDLRELLSFTPPEEIKAFRAVPNAFKA